MNEILKQVFVKERAILQMKEQLRVLEIHDEIRQVALHNRPQRISPEELKIIQNRDG